MSELRTLMNSFVMGESPRWHEDRLWFSDWGAQTVVAVWYGDIPNQRCVRVREGGQVLHTID